MNTAMHKQQGTIENILHHRSSFRDSAIIRRPIYPEKRARGQVPSAWPLERPHLLVLLVILSLVILYRRLAVLHLGGPPEAGEQLSFTKSQNIRHFWGQNSPLYEVPTNLSRSIPSDCEITFVQLLSRHGARSPTKPKTDAFQNITSHIRSSVTEYAEGYEFLRNYTYNLGTEQLTASGEHQMVESGRQFYKRYRSLASTESPFMRSADRERVVNSAQKWLQGFRREMMADIHLTSSSPHQYGMVIIPEGPGFNNSLSHGICTAFETGQHSAIGRAAQAIWVQTFVPRITDRLNKNLPGAKLSYDDTLRLMELCPFSTVANMDGTLSPFCALFSDNEWLDYDHLQSIGKWYKAGHGNPLGPSQGIGFVNELIARLTNRSVVDQTSTNSTLDACPETFPLGRAIYADFSHDTDMTAIYAALGLYDANQPPSNTTRDAPQSNGGYSAGWTVPFAARMYVEKMKCGTSTTELVRILVNDRVVPLRNCGADELGRCELGNFIGTLGFARRGGRWNMCFEE